MTDIGRKNQMEEVENMYIMMFSLQTLQNYGISIKETIENSLVHLWLTASGGCNRHSFGFTCACDHDTGDLPAYGKRV